MALSRHRCIVMGCLVAAGSGFVPSAATAEGPRAQVVGTTLFVEMADGTRKGGMELRGAIVTLQTATGPTRLHIASVLADARSPTLLLHEVEAQNEAGQWVNVCHPDAAGHRLAVFVAGTLGDDGHFMPDSQRVALSCTSGVQGKCILAGYGPSAPGRHAGDAVALFQSCLRMFRADYCGDGKGWTRDGMRIDLYDRLGLQVPSHLPDLAFEAAWTPAGAACVHHTRVPENGRLPELLAQCPRLRQAPNGEACTEAWARGQPDVLMFNRSSGPAP